jgi:hypothetical protein
MNTNDAKQIITYVVEATKWRWRQYDQSWYNIDRIFIRHGYEQGGFHMFKFVPLLEDRGIFSIKGLGSILSKLPIKGNKYERNYAGFIEAPFYLELKNGKRGLEGSRFYDAVSVFLNNRIGSPGRFFWRMIWELLVSCHYLSRNYDGSFARYLLTEYASFYGRSEVSNDDFLSISTELWEAFLQKRKPWKNLYGIGENTFDFIVGDIVEANFVVHSYKFDSANQHFFHITGISELIEPFDRNGTIRFLRQIELPYTLREINKGIYTYCSNTERDNFGYCRSHSKCQECRVSELCLKIFQG